jgi:hypothetical protein
MEKVIKKVGWEDSRAKESLENEKKLRFVPLPIPLKWRE